MVVHCNVFSWWWCVCVCQLWPCVAILAQVPFLTVPLLAVVCFSWSSKWTCSQWVTLRSVNDCTLPLLRASGMKTSNTCGGMTPNKSSGRRSTSYQPMGHSIVRPAYYQHPVQATWHIVLLFCDCWYCWPIHMLDHVQTYNWVCVSCWRQ